MWQSNLKVTDSNQNTLTSPCSHTHTRIQTLPCNNHLCLFQAQLKGHRLWTICAASRALASGGRGAATLKTGEKPSAMEMEKGRRGWCLRPRRMVAGMEHSHSPAVAPTACLRAWQGWASRLHRALLSKDAEHKLLRLDHILWIYE